MSSTKIKLKGVKKNSINPKTSKNSKALKKLANILKSKNSKALKKFVNVLKSKLSKFPEAKLKKRKQKVKKKTKPIPFSINEKRYFSLTKASEALKLKPKQLIFRLNSLRFPNYKKLPRLRLLRPKLEILKPNITTLKPLILTNVHLGHLASKWHPEMKPFLMPKPLPNAVFRKKKVKVHVLNIAKTLAHATYLSALFAKAGCLQQTILFVGTTNHYTTLLSKTAKLCNGYYVNEKWLGGLLTNWETINTLTSQLRKFDFLDRLGLLNTMAKKEASKLNRRRSKYEKLFGGVKYMLKKPSLIVVVGQLKEANVLKECEKLYLPSISLVDSNCRPMRSSFVIPTNDDSTDALKSIFEFIIGSVKRGELIRNKGNKLAAVKKQILKLQIPKRNKTHKYGKLKNSKRNKNKKYGKLKNSKQNKTHKYDKPKNSKRNKNNKDSKLRIPKQANFKKQIKQSRVSRINGKNFYVPTREPIIQSGVPTRKPAKQPLQPPIPVYAQEHWYYNIEQAAEAYKVDYQEMKRRLRSPQYFKYQWLNDTNRSSYDRFKKEQRDELTKQNFKK